jgi:hypothetical protein
MSAYERVFSRTASGQRCRPRESVQTAALADTLAALELLRQRVDLLRQLAGRTGDTEAELGNDLMSTAFEVHALAKVLCKGAEIETLKNALSGRYRRRLHSRAEVAA